MSYTWPHPERRLSPSICAQDTSSNRSKIRWNKMTPLGNGSDYYKKMLELQDRLRRSEEERIRLEERFSLLEHESRSRHQTCINRLRMRYIEFLEEQQARDERNHRLLGALDRVDSSLALMSAKTDRLGALRKQYETSVVSAYNNRTNGNMTGDSGVASQNDEKEQRSNNVASGSKNKLFLSDRRGRVFGREKNLTGPIHCFNQVRTDPRYGSNRAGIRYESSQMVHTPIRSAGYPQSGASLINKSGGSLSSGINSINPRSLLRTTKSCIDRDTSPQNSPAYEYRFNSSGFAAPEYSLRKAEPTSYSSDWHGAPARTVMRDLANCGSYDPFTTPSRSFDNASGYSRDAFQSEQHVAAGLAVPNLARAEPGKRLHGDSNYSGALKDRVTPAPNQAPYTKVADIVRQEVGDEEEYVGSVVEMELERYISEIRNLHREADPQSVEELDHEQNTSGDLLNVTLSDDGLDISVEDKPRPRALPQHLGNVLALAKDLANRTATSVNNVASVYHREVVDERREAGQTGAGADEGLLVVDAHTRCDVKDSPSASDAVYQTTSADPLLSPTGGYDDEGREVSNKKFPLLAKNGISAEVAKVSSELAARPRRNIEDVSKSARNTQEIRVGTIESSRIDKNERDSARFRLFDDNQKQDLRDDGDKLLTDDAAGLGKLDDACRVVTGEERESEDNFRDIAEELEPWSLGVLEKRVQDIILNEEAQSDRIQRESDGVDASRPEREEQATAEIDDKSYMDTKKMEDHVAGNETGDPNELCKNGTRSIGEPVESLSGMKDEGESSEKVKEDDISSVAIADQSINQLTQEYEEESREEGNVRETPDCPGATGNLVDPSIDHGATEDEKNDTDREDESYPRGEYPEDSDARYGYTETGRYQGNPNEQYQNYDPNNVEYEQDPSGRYPYVDPRYRPVYTEDPNAQREYEQDPNGHYSTDDGQRYIADANREYAGDPDQRYITDTSYERYAVDPNEEYSTNADQQQYQREEAYLRDGSGGYPASSADYIHPEGQEYADTEVYEPNVHSEPDDGRGYVEGQEASVVHESQSNFDEDPSRGSGDDRRVSDLNESAATLGQTKIPQTEERNSAKKSKDVIKSLLDSDTESTIERNVSNTESDFDFNQ